MYVMYVDCRVVSIRLRPLAYVTTYDTTPFGNISLQHNVSYTTSNLNKVTKPDRG